MATTKKSSLSLGSCFGKFYDIMGQIISILDVTTDVIVCVGFYQKGAMPFFAISLAIILLALIAYDIAFIFRFSRESDLGTICLFFCLLPLSPLLPYIFYLTADKDTALAKWFKNHFCGFKITFDSRSNNPESSKLRQFMEEKLEKHFGFIIEALVEAFPQSILQMIFIISYHEANGIAIASILLSMLSVSSKAFVFSIATALNLKQLFFNWISAVTDFFGIFFAVSFVFYQPSNTELLNSFSVIQNLWFYKVGTELVMIGCISVIIHIVSMLAFYYDLDYQFNYPSRCFKIGAMILVFFLITFLWAVGIITSILVFEITNWTWLAGMLCLLGTVRFSENKTSSEFWFTMVGWVNSAQKHRVGSMYKGCTSFTKKEDRVMRVCSVNYAILQNSKETSIVDQPLQNYLNEQREKSQYLKVKMSGIRHNTRDVMRGEFLRKFWFEFYGYFWDEVKGDLLKYWKRYRNSTCDLDDFVAYGGTTVGVAICTFVFGPIYFLTRMTTLLFPGFIVLYLYFCCGINIWNTEVVDMFQTAMITIYLCLCVALSILFYMNCCEQYLLAHFLPSESWIYFVNTEAMSKRMIKEITNHYFGIIVIPIRRAIVIEHFGPDLGSIILSYLPLTDEYENADKQIVKAKNVV